MDRSAFATYGGDMFIPGVEQDKVVVFTTLRNKEDVNALRKYGRWFL